MCVEIPCPKTDGKENQDEIEPIALSDCLATTSRLWVEAYEVRLRRITST